MSEASQGFPTPDHWHAHRVSYGETDQMGYLYYGEYLHILERARSTFIREQGMSYALVEERGLMLPVRAAELRYRRPARFDDLIQVHAGIQELGRASITFTYEVFDEPRAQLLATGMTQHAVTDLEGRPMRMPPWFRELCV